ncbi:hypothetical protein QTL95_16980 [Rhizobium sp. S152]|uniref:hypothetical protein n=1 Tax=Rhizobium sp. S152 TaxID=3055038 RepID=UPI0025AA00B0|nr:hypothetical protein [Rhizobium sp. S152]MDM9627600.1 hypothetical protein [Rhizobium sp. S152]
MFGVACSLPQLLNFERVRLIRVPGFRLRSSLHKKIRAERNALAKVQKPKAITSTEVERMSMDQSDNPTTNPIHALFAELGIVDPTSIAAAEEHHAELIEAYQKGKLTEAALRGSLSRNAGQPEANTLGEPVRVSRRDL